MTDNILQEWTLTSENGGNILLTFLSFAIEDDFSCAYDWVAVTYGDYSERFCGGENGDFLPGPITSCGSSMVIRFHSDSDTSHNGTGFRAVWEELSTSTPCCVPSTCDAANCLMSHADHPCSNYPDNADEVTQHNHNFAV